MGMRALGTRYDHLTLDERKLIFQLREAKMSVPRIAKRLGRHRSTIHREIRRNWHDDGPWLRGYFPQAAQSRTDRRRVRRRKLHQNPNLARHVIARLQQAWSPEQIAGRLRRESGGEERISHETIYQFVCSELGREQNLYQLLPCQRRRRRKRYARKPRGVTIPLENTFAERPTEIAARSSFCSRPIATPKRRSELPPRGTLLRARAPSGALEAKIEAEALCAGRAVGLCAP